MGLRNESHFHLYLNSQENKLICAMVLNYSQEKSVSFCMNRTFLVIACVDAMVLHGAERCWHSFPHVTDHPMLFPLRNWENNYSFLCQHLPLFILISVELNNFFSLCKIRLPFVFIWLAYSLRVSSFSNTDVRISGIIYAQSHRAGQSEPKSIKLN